MCGGTGTAPVLLGQGGPQRDVVEPDDGEVERDFLQYFRNSVVATAGTVIPAVGFSFMVAFAIVRGPGRTWCSSTATTRWPR